MGALLRLIEDVYKHLNSTVDFVNDDESKIISEFNTLFEVIENNGEEYFSENSTFSGSGSRGSQVRLYKMIKKDLKLY